MVAENSITLGQLRAAAVSPEARGIRLGGWDSVLVDGVKTLTLPADIREMADDIVGWFNPTQGWACKAVNTGLINRDRIHQSTAAKIVAKRIEADQLVLTFFLEAQKPPMVTRGIFRREEMLNLPTVFNPRREALVYFSDYSRSADVCPPKIGKVYPLRQALIELSSPYYLVSVAVATTGGNINERMFAALTKTKVEYKPDKDLAITVIIRDLIDHTRLEANRYRRLNDRLVGKFMSYP